MQTYYNQYFNPNETYLVVIGDVDTKATYKLIKNILGNGKRRSKQLTVPEAKSNVDALEINFVDMPNAVQSNISLQAM